MNRVLVVALLATYLVLGAGSARAHFQLLYPGESARMTGGNLDLLMVFTHPFYGEPNMIMEPPQALYFIRQRGNDGKPEKVDLLPLAKKFDWIVSGRDPVAAYRVAVPPAQSRPGGDYVFVLQPAPYLEAAEDKYIQQFTKTIVNVGGVPGNWDKPVGLPAEIRPLNKPYAKWTGSVFRGVVLSKGKPVPFAEVEVEYVNRQPGADGWVGEPRVSVSHPALGPQSIRADANGAFVIGLPKAGWWGIAALGIGPVKQYKGKPLSQDAVLWVQVTDVK